MKKHTYTKVLAHKGKFTHSARLYHLSTKGLAGQSREITAYWLHQAYKSDAKPEVSA